MTFSWLPATGRSAVWWRLQASGSTRWTYPSSPRPTAAPPACPCSSDRAKGAPCGSTARNSRLSAGTLALLVLVQAFPHGGLGRLAAQRVASDGLEELHPVQRKEGRGGDRCDR